MALNLLSVVKNSALLVSVTFVLGMLTKWFYTTRLETRTKESNIYASIWVSNPHAQ